MKKYYINIWTVTLLSLFFTGCSDFLETNPTRSADSEEVFSTSIGAEAAYNGAFTTLMEWFNSFAYPGYGSIKIAIDAMGNDIAATNRYGSPWPNYQFLMTNNKTSSVTRTFWTKYYSSINQSNIIIANTLNNTEYDGSEIAGKAYFLRAFCYFDLVRLYGSCPIYTEPLTDITNTNPLSSKEDIYQLIIQDLKAAEELLANYSRTDNDMPDLSVVQGLLARVYLTHGDWAQAASYAHNARQNYSLMDKAQFQSGFNNRSNPEWMWCFAQSASQSDMSYVFHYLDNISINNGGLAYYTGMRPDPYFRELFEPNDARRDGMFSWDTSSGNGLGFMTYNKFKTPQSLFADLVLMRSAEMYLIEAESLARNGQLSESEGILSELLNTRNATFATGLSQDELIEVILVERRKELWNEGFALLDILRTGKSVERKKIDPTDPLWSDFPFDPNRPSLEPKGHSILTTPNKQDFEANSIYYQFAIPETETQNNPNLAN